MSLGDEHHPTNGTGWTLKSLYELIREIDKRHTQALDDADRRYEERYVGQLREVKTALDGQAQAVDKAEKSSEKRFDEFRREIGEKLDDLITSRDTGAGKGLANRENFGYLVGIASIIYVALRIATGHG